VGRGRPSVGAGETIAVNSTGREAESEALHEYDE